jgi:formiminoglutamase
VTQGIDPQIWRGRNDQSEVGDVRRLFQIVRAPDQRVDPGDPALIGFACDAGVARNQGRIGAAQGPVAARRFLAGLPAHDFRTLWDFGDVSCTDGDLEAAQARLATRVSEMLDLGLVPVVLGGGHEVAWGTYQGLARWLAARDMPRQPRKLLILNLDAHFDLRSSRPGSSGTPFDQIAHDCEAGGRPFQYACWGVSRIANTPALYMRARMIGASVIEDDSLQERHLQSAIDRLEALIDLADDVYLSIDMDVLPASVAPGVSAPAPYGVPLTVIESLARQVRRSGKMRVADIAEFNPAFDIDGHTARVVARLAWHLLGDTPGGINTDRASSQVIA